MLDTKTDELLLMAEQRLQGPSPIDSARLSTQLPVKATPPIRTAREAEDDLAIRVPRMKSVKNGGAKDNAGPNWFGMPKTDPTPELKRDWQFLRMRGLLDPKHQKKALRPTLPEYSHVGEVVEGPTDFHSARLTRRERKQTIFDEVMSAHDRTKIKKKYTSVQQKNAEGKKAFYKKLVSQRRKH